MKTLINQLRDLKRITKDLLLTAKVRKDEKQIDFYKGEFEALKIAITYAECRLKEQEER